MSLTYKKFTNNVGLIAIVNLVLVIKAIIFVPLITKMLGAFSFGVWTQLLVTVGLVAPMIRLGLTNSIVRYIAAEKNNEEIKEGVYATAFTILALSFLVCLFFILFINPISNFFRAPMVLVGVLPFIILFECLNMIFLTTFQALLKMGKYAFYMILLSIGEITLVVASIYLGYGLIGAVISLLIAKAAIFSILFADIYQIIGFKIPKFTLIKKYLSFGFPTTLSNVPYIGATSIDKYLVGFFLGTLFVGYYAPAYSLGNMISFFIIPISFVLFPAVSKSYDENRIYEVKTKLRYSLKYFLIVSLPAVFGMSILSKSILTLFATEEIAQKAYFVTPFVATGILFYGLTDIFSQILILVKKTYIVGYTWIASAILNILLNIFLIPKLSIMGAAISTLVVFLFSFLFIWICSFREFTFTIDWLSIIKMLLCSLVMSLVIWQINPHGFFELLYSIIIGIIIYGFLIVVTKVFSKKEVDFLAFVLKK